MSTKKITAKKKVSKIEQLLDVKSKMAKLQAEQDLLVKELKKSVDNGVYLINGDIELSITENTRKSLDKKKLVEMFEERDIQKCYSNTLVRTLKIERLKEA